MKLYVYIDSFNLYYGSLKNTPYRWLNPDTLCKFLFPYDEIVAIKYFTAPIKIQSGDDVDRPNRQQIYFRALRTVPHIQIIEGTFLSHNVSMRRVDGRGFAHVIKSEEKGTDVNIASHLVNDAHLHKFEKAVVISNDSDLVSPIKMVTTEIGLPVTIISPYPRNNIQLKEVATEIKQLRTGVLRASQFDEKLKDATGEFSRPSPWN